MQEITLRGMRFHALVGILDYEHQVRQPIEIDLLVRVAETSGASVVDYRKLYDVAAASIKEHTDFLEQIADRVAEAALALNPRVRSARVAVRKIHVPLPGPLAYAEVVVDRSASEP
jgi:7,8-dihydroneopterin aldolase/epimerase/oxygenase